MNIIDTCINISLAAMLILTDGAGFLKLYLIRKEKRETARENAREEELWK